MVNNKVFEDFESAYHKEIKEILILTSDSWGARQKYYDSYVSSMYFLAYIDLSSNELKNGDGRVNWFISAEDSPKFGIKGPYYFKLGTIYRLKVRELIDKTVPEGRLPSYYNRFMVVEMLESDVANNELLSVLNEYRKPVEFTDKFFGKFIFNRQYKWFEGSITVDSNEIPVTLASKGDIDSLHFIRDDINGFIKDAKQYAAKELLDRGNQWQEEGWEGEGEYVPMTEPEFVQRITLTNITLEGGENSFITLWFDDGDIFWRHAITVDGDVKSGFSSADISG